MCAPDFPSVYVTSHIHSLEKLQTTCALPTGLICMQIFFISDEKM